MGHPAGKTYVSFADYFEAENTSEERHEWIDGVMYAMSRGTPEHGRLVSAINRELGVALRGRCTVYSESTMLYVQDANISTYAGVTIVCDPVLTMTVKRNGKSLGEAVTNPTVIVEVLSQSTERYDRQEKFGYYKQLASLQEYVLVSQDLHRIEVFRRMLSLARQRSDIHRSNRVLLDPDQLIPRPLRRCNGFNWGRSTRDRQRR